MTTNQDTEALRLARVAAEEFAKLHLQKLCQELLERNNTSVLPEKCEFLSLVKLCNYAGPHNFMLAETMIRQFSMEAIARADTAPQKLGARCKRCGATTVQACNENGCFGLENATPFQPQASPQAPSQEPYGSVLHDGSRYDFMPWDGTWHGGTVVYAPPPPTPVCTRSHPHENMDAFCERLTEDARTINRLAQDKRDAERYQWLRGHAWTDVVYDNIHFGPGYVQTKPETIDAAIDAAIAAGKGEK